MKYPVIATRGLVVFPNHKMVIEVGRPSSLKAIDLTLASQEKKIIVVSQKDAMLNDVNQADQIFKIATLATVVIERKFANGSVSINVTGEERVELLDLDFHDGEYIDANISILKPIEKEDESEQSFVEIISKQLEQMVGSVINIPKAVLTTMADGVSAGELADVIAHYLPLTFAKKQKLLEAIEVSVRLDLINKFISEETQMVSIDKSIDSSIKKNLDNQQKEYLLRERMRTIKEELGDLSTKDTEIDDWREKLKDAKFPKEVRARIEEEIRKYEAMPPISAEAHVSKGYIEWLIKLPWRTYSEDRNDLNLAKTILNKYHYGLKEVKDRIIEHLAVKINTKNNSSPIITLVGPPGVGKTSLAKSVAEAMGREMIKVSLGGVRDEAEIRGHRRTYVGAMPGKIIQAINRAQTSNPIILLDEIDKMASDHRGDPTSAMLEVLDPEQNAKFQDHYLELEYDLSQVMFLATANYYDQIPGPLIDRVEIITLEQYTSEEKLEIAREYIIPQVLKENGLDKTLFRIEDEVINYVTSKYTLEAGVRGLKRIFDKLARKIVVLKLENKIQHSYHITIDEAKKLLGKEKVTKEPLAGKAEVGLTNGMYYSSVGGGILPIEVSTYPSKTGGTVLTGSIKEVMQESLKIAVAYLRSNAEKYGINFAWDEKVIQVHVPEGATPKDGPSAGITFTTAVLSSLLNKAVPRDIAMTGEITLRGKVLEIGGLKEKSVGAVELGINKIFIPKSNEKDIPELAQKVRDIAQIIPVESYDEVFQNIFA